MTTTQTNKVEIPDRMFFRIGDVADLIGVKPYVLRYWESEFPMISPQKSSSGQRVYRRGDVEFLVMIRHLLYVERYSIEGARKRIKELRKDGSLKEYQSDVVAGVALKKSQGVAKPLKSAAQSTHLEEIPRPSEIELADKCKDLLQLANDLKDLSQISISELFKRS